MATISGTDKVFWANEEGALFYGTLTDYVECCMRGLSPACTALTELKDYLKAKYEKKLKDLEYARYTEV